MMPYKSFDNDINEICNPLLTKPRDFLCIYNLAIKGFGNLMILFYCDFVKLPPYPTKITYNCKVFPRVFAYH